MSNKDFVRVIKICPVCGYKSVFASDVDSYLCANCNVFIRGNIEALLDTLRLEKAIAERALQIVSGMDHEGDWIMDYDINDEIWNFGDMNDWTALAYAIAVSELEGRE